MPLWWLEVQIAHELLALRPWQPFNITATLGGETENLMEQVGDQMGEPYPSELCRDSYLAG